MDGSQYCRYLVWRWDSRVLIVASLLQIMDAMGEDSESQLALGSGLSLSFLEGRGWGWGLSIRFAFRIAWDAS